MLCVTIFVILVVWFLLPRVARLMIHTPTAISIFVCLSMVQLMAVFISMRCTLCGYFLLFFSSRRRHTRLQGDWSSDVCSSDLTCRMRASLLVLGCALEACSHPRSEERRVGKECRSRWSPHHEKKNTEK